jgi:hypothetical protein
VAVNGVTTDSVASGWGLQADNVRAIRRRKTIGHFSSSGFFHFVDDVSCGDAMDCSVICLLPLGCFSCIIIDSTVKRVFTLNEAKGFYIKIGMLRYAQHDKIEFFQLSHYCNGRQCSGFTYYTEFLPLYMLIWNAMKHFVLHKYAVCTERSYYAAHKHV